MSHNLTAELVFQINSKIGSVELATLKGKSLFSQTREGHTKVAPQKQDTLLKLRSELLTEINRRSDTPADMIEFVLTSYGNRYGLIIPRGEKHLRLSVDKDVTVHELIEIAHAAKRLEL